MPIRLMINSGNLRNLILWGPPASGKTTLARIIGNESEAEFITLSAVMSGKEELKKVLEVARQNSQYNKNTILFVDEIHRWNKAQQDALLPHVEDGTIILIGATTENPSFSIISPLLSRSQVFVLNPLTKAELNKIVSHGYETLMNQKPTKTQHELLNKIASSADGDARYALNILDSILSSTQDLTLEVIQNSLQRSLHYDKNGEEHFNLISAVHKSLRSSNPSAGVYWVLRMLEAGEDPLYVARRLIRFASEDIGNANPNALLFANQVHHTIQAIGMPECSVAIVQLAEYLANSPKSNASYLAQKQAQQDIRAHGSLPVPLHLRNASTKLMKDLDYGKGYEYDHDLENKQSEQECFPDQLEGTDYYS
jgi:putative ATPase